MVVSTDIGGDPDDRQSLVRLLLYSNVLDIEGLIGAGYQANPLRGDTSKINEVIAAYASVRDNLLAHEAGFPTAAYLFSITAEGQRFDGLPGMEGVGNGFSTQGSDLIIDILSKDDDRPVWFLAWGGISTLAQAIWDINGSSVFTQAQKEEMLGKIVVYDIAGQDNAGAWIASEHSYIPYIRNQKIFRAMSIHSAGNWPESDLLDPPYNSEAYFDNWYAGNVINNHGVYGTMYPPAAWIYEGDSPSFMFLLPNGLNDPAAWWQGSWGGRFSREKELNPVSSMGGVFQSSEDAYKPFYMYAKEYDTWTYPGGSTYTDNIYATLHRWRPAFDNDFAARMDWTLTNNFSLVNHPPVVVLNGDTSKAVIYLNASSGQIFNLNAAGTYNPNPEYSLNYNWWMYPEPSIYNGSFTNLISYLSQSEISFQVPSDAVVGDEFHVILTVTNNGKSYNTAGQGALGTLPLTSYRRIVVQVVNPGAYLNLRLFLEGPYEGTEMNAELNSAGLLPLSQPYHQSPWNYYGTETVNSIPHVDVVDWILVELRDAPNAVSAEGSTMFDRQAAFLLRNGSVVGMDGNSLLEFNEIFSNQLYVVIWHRNHLAIMSSAGLQAVDNVYTYDFSASSSKVLGGSSGYNEIGNGLWGMAAGDSNQDKKVDGIDKIFWTNNAGEQGYHMADCNLDGETNNPDKKDAWFFNVNMASQVPD
ncbi:MAG: DUF1593 domain-containing protein [Bacteroidales bacterium]